MRPIFETTLDMSIEREIALAYAAHYHLRPVKRPALAVYDYDMLSAISDRAIIRIEIKGRKPEYKGFIESGGYMLSAKKFDALKKLHGDVPVGLVVVFTNSPDMHVFYFSPHKVEDLKPVIGGRTRKKRDRQDIEHVVYIPWDRFVTI